MHDQKLTQFMMDNAYVDDDEEYEFEYEDEDAENDLDADVENKYYNAKCKCFH